MNVVHIIQIIFMVDSIYVMKVYQEKIFSHIHIINKQKQRKKKRPQKQQTKMQMQQVSTIDLASGYSMHTSRDNTYIR